MANKMPITGLSSANQSEKFHCAMSCHFEFMVIIFSVQLCWLLVSL